jgi:small GTP-binding protein
VRTAKVCIIGDFAVGKTSTVARFVNDAFSEEYLTTVGVKIDTKTVATGNGPIKLVIWDVAGTDTLSSIEFAYLRGSAGIILVADGTRRNTINNALRLREDLVAQYGALPFVAMLNKADLSQQWEITDDDIEASRKAGIEWIVCSAKSGQSVGDAIESLANVIASSSNQGT